MGIEAPSQESTRSKMARTPREWNQKATDSMQAWREKEQWVQALVTNQAARRSVVEEVKKIEVAAAEVEMEVVEAAAWE